MEPRIKVGDNGGPERMVNRERAGGGRKLRRGEGERSGKGWKEEKLVTERGKKRRERERVGEDWTNKRRRKVGRVSSARDRSAKLSASLSE